MKYLLIFSFLAVGVFCGAFLFGESAQSEEETSEPVFNWSLLWTGSWEDFSDEKGNLYNRGEFKLDILPLNLTLRSQVLDRRQLIIDPEQVWGNPDKQYTDFNGGLYHNPTGSRFLIGVLDEWGLSARIRNPWIRSPPYAENHKPQIADLKTAVSTTKEEEAYLYLSTPYMEISPDVKLRSFISAQTEVEDFKPAFSGGLDFKFPNKTSLLFESFYTGSVLPAFKSSTWFSDPPPLPEREFDLYSAGILFSNPLIAISSDFALSETFAWGTDIYTNFGITVSPLLPKGRIQRPLSVSLAVDGAGERFVCRDGLDHGAGFRSAAKIELKGERSSLFRINTVLRAPEIGEDFNRRSSGIYYRFTYRTKNDDQPLRLTRISLTADRNAVNPEKITDGVSGYLGLSLNLQKLSINTPFGLNFSGSIKGITEAEKYLSPYPVPDSSWEFDSAGISCELTWYPAKYQFKTKIGYSNNAKNQEKWSYSISTAARFKKGRLSLKLETPDFPEKWSGTVSWRLEIK